MKKANQKQYKKQSVGQKVQTIILTLKIQNIIIKLVTNRQIWRNKMKTFLKKYLSRLQMIIKIRQQIFRINYNKIINYFMKAIKTRSKFKILINI